MSDGQGGRDGRRRVKWTVEVTHLGTSEELVLGVEARSCGFKVVPLPDPPQPGAADDRI